MPTSYRATVGYYSFRFESLSQTKVIGGTFRVCVIPSKRPSHPSHCLSYCSLPTASSFSSGLAGDMRRALCRSNFHDLVFKVGDQTFCTHKLIVCARLQGDTT